MQRPSVAGVVEDFLNIDQTVKLYRQLSNNPEVEIYMTRELDKSDDLHSSGHQLWQMSSLDNLISKNIAKDLLSRGRYANHVSAEALVGVHNNLGGGCGTEIWYDTKNGYGYTSLNLAQSISKKLISNIPSRWNGSWCDRGVKSSNSGYSELREFFGPAVIIEVGFMDNASDRNALINKTFQQIVAEGVAQGVEDFIASRSAYSYQNLSIILLLYKGVDRFSVISRVTTSYTNQLAVGANSDNPMLKNLNIIIFKPEIRLNVEQLVGSLNMFDSQIQGASINNIYKTQH